ncbi:MAG: putative lipid II flippase FtsW [Oscillospiraceae bacterium]|nr:putative lipid II flippase FtsW [Oscillospiraceae bacterium]
MARYDNKKDNTAAGVAEKQPRRREPRVTLRERISSAERRGPIDMPFFILVLMILAIGVVMVLSSSFARSYFLRADHDAVHFFRNQLIFAAAGVVVMLLVSIVPANWFRRYSGMLLLITVIVLIAVLIPGIGQVRNGARRWIGIGDTLTFQPSEIAKITVIIYSAHLACLYRDHMKTFRWGTLPFVVLIGGLAGLVMLERHFSGTIIVGLVGVIMMFAAGTNILYLGGLAAAGGAGLAGLILLTGYSSDRVSAWLDPFADLQGGGWQIVQSLYAIGSGGFLGVGLGQSRQKYLYLPESYNDYIFSIVCEELGFIGATLVLMLFALLICRGYWLALHAKDRFSFLVITGITSLVAIQTILNIAVVTNTIPATGISLPFFSYGGTALLLQLAEMGVILSLSRDIPMRKAKKSEEAEEK